MVGLQKLSGGQDTAEQGVWLQKKNKKTGNETGGFCSFEGGGMAGLALEGGGKGLGGRVSTSPSTDEIGYDFRLGVRQSGSRAGAQKSESPRKQ